MIIPEHRPAGSVNANVFDADQFLGSRRLRLWLSSVAITGAAAANGEQELF